MDLTCVQIKCMPHKCNKTLGGRATWYKPLIQSCSMPPLSAAFEKAAIAGMSAMTLSVGAVGRLKL